MSSMNPSSNETGGLQLPPPIMEQPVASSNPAEQTLAAPEQAPAAAEKTGGAQPAPPMITPAMTLPAPPPAAADPTAATVTAQSAASSILDDKDLIEKAWVNKAKQIVALNRDDPYKQSEELTVFRADYMKKHYDKNIKLSK